jgi:hypothetical protein
MSRIQKNNMKSHWKNFSVKIKRLYNIFFNTRDIEIIRQDYFSGKWISKEEVLRLLESEERQFIKSYNEVKSQYDDVLRYFNMNALSNYSHLEHKLQGTLKK